MIEESRAQEPVAALPAMEDVEHASQDRSSSIWGVVVVVVTLVIACVSFAIAVLFYLPSRPAQIKPLVAHPDFIDFGTLPQGGIAEASLIARAQGVIGDGAGFQARADAGMTATPVSLVKQEWGPTGWIHGQRLVLKADTGTAGKFDLNLRITWNGEVLDVPVRFTVRERSEGRSRVLVTQTPFVGEFTSDGTVFDAWRVLVTRADLEVDYLDTEDDNGATLAALDLAPYATVMLAADALRLLEDPAFHGRLIAYVENGGRLFLAASALQGGSVQHANQLVTQFGLELVYKDVAESTLPEPGSALDIPGLPGLVGLRLHHWSPIRLTDPGRASVIVPAPGFPGLACVARASVGKGEIIVVGQARWCQWIGDKVMAGFDNARLLEVLLIQTLIDHEQPSDAGSLTP